MTELASHGYKGLLTEHIKGANNALISSALPESDPNGQHDTAFPDVEREGRECTVCPPWVVRCVHYDHGTDITEWIALHRNTVGDWVICSGFGDPKCDSKAPAHQRGSYVGLYLQPRRDPDEPANDYDAALAAFHEAEARLLGREAQP